MSNREMPLLYGLKSELGSLKGEVGQMLKLRWQLAKIELLSDLCLFRRLTFVAAMVFLMLITAIPTLLVLLAMVLNTFLGINTIGWLAIFGFGLLATSSLAAWLAWRHFKRQFIGLEESLEELAEDAVWLREWSNTEAK